MGIVCKEKQILGKMFRRGQKVQGQSQGCRGKDSSQRSLGGSSLAMKTKICVHCMNEPLFRNQMDTRCWD